MHRRLGPKRALCLNSQEEIEELHNLYSDLRQRLTVYRCDRLCGRSLACWDPEEQAVRVQRKDGKFGKFGYARNGKLFLENFEAMFLLELGRLQLESHSMVLSIEQAYLLLLGELTSPKYYEYLVYSHLTRTGFILVRHQNLPYGELVDLTIEDCAWELALSTINNLTVSEYVKRSSHYSKAEKHLILVKEAITQQHCDIPSMDKLEAPKIDFNRKMIFQKRKFNEESNESENPTEAKRRYIKTSNKCKSLVDFLKDEVEYKPFVDVFAKFDIIHLSVPDGSDKENLRALQINYDVYLHNDGFKKSTPKPPTFRLVILGSNEPFPTNVEISQCCKLQKYMTPLLVISIGESKQMQAFLYYFS